MLYGIMPLGKLFSVVGMKVFTLLFQSSASVLYTVLLINRNYRFLKIIVLIIV